MIVDTHVHFYDPTRPAGVPWPSPSDTVLYRPVLPRHYRALAVPQGVAGVIVVEASPWLDDNAWILDLAANESLIVGFVGNLDIADPDFVRNLDRFAQNPLFRGIRLGRDVIPTLTQDGSLARVERLATLDLALDLLVNPAQLPAVASLAECLPRLRIVLDHVAHVPIDGRAPAPVWLEGIAALSSRGNVYCKISGLVEAAQESPPPDRLEYYLPTLEALWDNFGGSRLIYGSNWPVSERFADYATVQRLAVEYARSKGPDATEALLWRNSKAAYHWIDRNE